MSHHSGRNGLVWAGTICMLAAIAMPVAMFATADVGGVIAGFVFMFFLSPILFVLGLVLLVVGLARGNRQQQQQQQVIVVTDDGTEVLDRSHGAAAQAPACRQCGNALGASAQFCTRCGRTVHG